MSKKLEHRKKKKMTAEEEEFVQKCVKELPLVRPLYFKRPDSEKLFGVPARVLEDLAMKKEGPPYYRRGKYSIYEVTIFEKWLTENPVQTTMAITIFLWVISFLCG